MQIYPIPMVPGPVKVASAVLRVYQTNYGSGDLEEEFLALYAETALKLGRILGTRNTVVIQTGESMLALWGALKSCLKPGDRVLAIATGVFGYGIADMAQSIGAEVQTIGLGYDETLSDMSVVERAMVDFKPKMITAVHCETPSGTLNPLAELGRLKRQHAVPLLYVDAVASAGGTALLVDDWHIDLCLGGAQKCLAAPPEMCFLSVSDAAWEVVGAVDYVGYDALKPFQTALADCFFPYTPSWHGVASLNAAAETLLQEGLENCFKRHCEVARFCRHHLKALGLRLFPASDAIPSPTVTAVKVPHRFSWPEMDRRLRQRGLVLGGSHGPLAGKVFRLGHMGTQADRELVRQALAGIKEVVSL